MRTSPVLGRGKSGAVRVISVAEPVILAAGTACSPAVFAIRAAGLPLAVVLLINPGTVLTLTLIVSTLTATVLIFTVILLINTVTGLTLTIIEITLTVTVITLSIIEITLTMTVLTLSIIKMTVTRQELPVWVTAKGMKTPDSPLTEPGLPLHTYMQADNHKMNCLRRISGAHSPHGQENGSQISHRDTETQSWETNCGLHRRAGGTSPEDFVSR